MPAGQITGLGSGIQWQDTVDQLMELEKQPIYMKQARIKDIEEQNSAWSSISTQLGSLQSVLDSMDTLSELMIKTATSSDTSKLTVTANEDANSGAYDVEINQLANGHRMISEGYSSLSATLFSSNGVFSYQNEYMDDPVEINVTTSTNLSDLKRKINAQTKGDVTASIMNDGDDTNPYRLILTSKSTGEKSAIDLSGTTAGMIKEFRDVAIGDAQKTAGAGTSSLTSYGNIYNGPDEEYTFNVTASGTIGASSTGTIEMYDSSNTLIQTLDLADIDGSGNPYVAGDKISLINGMEITLSAGDIVDDTIPADQDIFTINTSEATARDSIIVVENIVMQKDGNTISDVIEGVSLNLKDITDPNTPISVVVDNDKSGVKDKINNLVNSYNTVITTIEGYTKWGGDTKGEGETEENQNGALFGESQATGIKTTLATVISNMNSGIDEDQYYKTLNQVGIELGTDGKLSVDTSKLDEALDDNFDETIKLFTLNTELSGPNSDNFSLNTTTRATQGGSYDISVDVDASGAITSASINGHSASINGSFITGADGNPEEGMMVWVDLSDPAVHGTTLTSKIDISTGKNVELSNIIEQLIKTDTDDTKTGTIDLRKNSLNRTIDQMNEDIATMETRLEMKRKIMEAQWLAMENAVTEMNNQSAASSAMMG